MTTPYLVRRGQGWYLRLRVPSDLAPLAGTHVVRSLGTTDRRTAQVRAAAAVAASPEAWEAARLTVRTWLGVPTSEVDTETVDAALADWPRAEAEYDGLPPDAQAQIRDRMTAVMLAEQDDRDALADRVRRGRAVLTLTDAARAEGLIEGLTRALANGRSAASPAAPQAKEARKPWTELQERFFLDNPSIGPSTRVSHEQAFRDWKALVGDKQLGDLKKADVKTYADWLRDRISNRGRPLDRKSIVRLLQYVKSFLTWCKSSGFIDADPGEGIQARSRTREERDAPDKRRAFTPKEVTTLFDSPLFTGFKTDRIRSKPGSIRTRDEKYWFFVIALFTGGRTEEIATAPATLVDLDGTVCVDYRHAIKTGAGPRLVPVIPELKKLGFIKWVDSQAQKGRGLVTGPNGSEDWSKWCNRYMDDIGLTDERLTLYSLRHSFRQMLRAANIGDELTNKIFGHEGGVGDGYGRDLSPAEARTAATAIRAPIPLDHLRQIG